MYSRANLSRSATSVDAPVLTATSTTVAARGFRAATTRGPSADDRAIFRDAAVRSGRVVLKVE